MFDSLTNKLSNTFKVLRGNSRITEANIEEALKDVRKSFLDADVSLEVVKKFIEEVKVDALGTKVAQSLNPAEQLIKIFKERLTETLGGSNEAINLKVSPPAVIMMAGLQGAGKTTSLAKLAKYLAKTHKKRILCVSTDVYRPSAIEQLQILVTDLQKQKVSVDFQKSTVKEKPKNIAKDALKDAQRGLYDILLVDTAGRLQIDDAMMGEVQELAKILKPVETLFVADAMTGQDASNVAATFNKYLKLTGIILTKVDGDARGGAALSTKYVTGKPIKFIGVGEKIDDFTPFHPDRLAGQILGMGDVLSLIEKVEERVDKQKAAQLAKKMIRNQFDLSDYQTQLQELNNLGGINSMLDKLPGMSNKNVNPDVVDKEFSRSDAIINSMTKQERSFPTIIKGSRKRRIASGSGVEVQDVNRLLKQFDQMQRMMKKVKGGGMQSMMQKMSQMNKMGGMPR